MSLYRFAGVRHSPSPSPGLARCHRIPVGPCHWPGRRPTFWYLSRPCATTGIGDMSAAVIRVPWLPALPTAFQTRCIWSWLLTWTPTYVLVPVSTLCDHRHRRYVTRRAPALMFSAGFFQCCQPGLLLATAPRNTAFPGALALATSGEF